MDHIIARPGIAGIQDLKGKRLGFSGVGSVTHFSALSLARQLGWNPDRDITLVAGSANLDALKQDKVDAILTSAMGIALARQAGFKDIGDLSVYKMPMAGSGIMVDKAYLAAHRDTVLRFLKADIEATALMQKDRRVFDAALAKWFNITDPKTQEGMFAHVHKFEKKPYPSVDGIKRVLARLRFTGDEDAHAGRILRLESDRGIGQERLPRQSEVTSRYRRNALPCRTAGFTTLMGARPRRRGSGRRYPRIGFRILRA